MTQKSGCITSPSAIEPTLSAVLAARPALLRAVYDETRTHPGIRPYRRQRSGALCRARVGGWLITNTSESRLLLHTRAKAIDRI
jgi:hypothetical protein